MTHVFFSDSLIRRRARNETHLIVCLLNSSNCISYHIYVVSGHLQPNTIRLRTRKILCNMQMFINVNLKNFRFCYLSLSLCLSLPACCERKHHKKPLEETFYDIFRKVTEVSRSAATLCRQSAEISGLHELKSIERDLFLSQFEFIYFTGYMAEVNSKLE